MVLDEYLIFAAQELMLFAVIGFIIGGIDDFVVDAIWIIRSLWRRLTIYPFHQRACVASLAKPTQSGRIVVFVAAWDEAAVIARMLNHAIRAFDHDNYRIYVGCYPNDPETIAAVKSVGSPHVRMVVGDRGIM